MPDPAEEDLQRRHNETHKDCYRKRLVDFADVITDWLDYAQAEPATFLDVGCRWGDLKKALHVYFPHARVDAVDIVKEWADKAGAYHADICCTPFADNSYECIVCSHVLEHTRDLQQAAREITRIGSRYLFIIAPLQYNNEENRTSCPDHHTFMPDPRSWTKVFVDAGWKINAVVHNEYEVTAMFTKVQHG
jgi:SAM-dependent methyltransferase